MTIGTRVADYRYDDAYNAKALGAFNSRVWRGDDALPGLSQFKQLIKSKNPGSWHEYCNDKYSEIFAPPFEGDTRKFEHIVTGRLRQLRSEWKHSVDAYQSFRAEAWSQRNIEVQARKNNPHPYDCTIEKSRDYPCFVKLLPYILTYKDVGAAKLLGTNVTLPNCWDGNDENHLIEKLRSKINGVDGFNAGVALAELDKTLVMLKDVAKVLRRGGQQAGSGNLPGAARVLFFGTNSHHAGFDGLPRAAQLYLGFQFGVVPLLDDVKQGAQTLGWHAGSPITNTYRVRRRRGSEMTSRNPYSVTMSVQETGQIIALLTAPPAMADVTGLTDLPSAIWERIPWSFVVDWWIPIGGALSAMQMARSLTGKFVKTRVTTTRRGPYRSGDGSYATYQVIGDTSSYVSVVIKREVLPGLIAKMPNLKPVFHPKTSVRMRHTIEAGALLIVNRKSVVKGLTALENAAAKWRGRNVKDAFHAALT